MRAPELLSLAIDWLRAEFPDAVIVPEMSVADWGGARIDVAAITDAEIVGVEIKGEGDSPTRLELQGLRYGQVARQMWLLVTPEGTLRERCEKKRPANWGLLEVHDGEVRPANRATKLGPPKKSGSGGVYYGTIADPDSYKPSTAHQLKQQCAFAMCGTLWRDELHDIAVREGLAPSPRMRVSDLTDLVIESLPVPTLHGAMIDQLRNRKWGPKTVIDPRRPEEKGLFPNRKSPNRPIQGNLLNEGSS